MNLRLAGLGGRDPARGVQECVEVRQHHRGAEVNSCQSELRERGEGEPGESAPRAGEHEDEWDCDEELRLENQEAEGDSGEPCVICAEREKSRGEAGQDQSGDLSANQEMIKRRKRQRSDKHGCAVWAQTEASAPEQVNAGDKYQQAERDPDSGGGRKRELRQRNETERDLRSVEIGESGRAVDDLLYGLGGNVLIVEFGGAALGNQLG